jgi:hypothetical protein
MVQASWRLTEEIKNKKHQTVNILLYVYKTIFAVISIMVTEME